MKTILFSTSNTYKANEAKVIFAKNSIKIEPITLEIVEPQWLDARDVALKKAEQAFKQTRRPVIVDEGGVFIESLNGFPGTLTGPVVQMLGIEGLMKLLNDEESAIFQSVAVYRDHEQTLISIGRLRGVLRKEISDTLVLLSDIFVPQGQTKALSFLVKEGIFQSHRAIALSELCSSIKGIEK